MQEPDPDSPNAAAILNDGGADADALLAQVAAQQRALGRRVRGLLMTYPEGDASCAAAMVLVDLHTADEYLVSQPMGRGSTGCRADPQGFARASRVLDQALADAPDLVVCNRFGNLEAEGGGFAAEMLALMAQVGPPDWATNRFPASSAIILRSGFLTDQTAFSNPVCFRLKLRRNLANRFCDCQR